MRTENEVQTLNELKSSTIYYFTVINSSKSLFSTKFSSCIAGLDPGVTDPGNDKFYKL